jgi:hypothetical protein
VIVLHARGISGRLSDRWARKNGRSSRVVVITRPPKSQFVAGFTVRAYTSAAGKARPISSKVFSLPARTSSHSWARAIDKSWGTAAPCMLKAPRLNQVVRRFRRSTEGGT